MKNIPKPKTGYLPAKDPENIKLSDVSEALARIGIAQSTNEHLPALQQITRSRKEVLAQHNLKQILGKQQDSGNK